AAWFAWSAVTQWQADQRLAGRERARDRRVKDTAAAVAEQARALGRQLQREEVAAALQSGDAGAASAALAEGWKQAEAAQVLRGDLAAAHADAANFGYARLALLQRALTTGSATAAVVRDGKKVALGVAAPVQLGDVQAVAYVRMPLTLLTVPLEAAPVPDGSYLALRQGNYNVAQRGEAGLASSADVLSRPIGDEGLRAAAAVPYAASGPFGLGAIPCLAGAAVLGLGVLVLLLVGIGRLPSLGRARPRRAEAGDDAPTFSQTLEMEAQNAPQPVRTTATTSAPPPEDLVLDPGIFRAYDIRGVVGPQLDPKVASYIGQAIGTVMAEEGLVDIVVGRDGRLSGPELVEGLVEGLRKSGRNVIDIGMAPTPVVYFAAYHLRAGSGVAVTGSHNPPDYNGFKIVVGGRTLS